MRLPASTKCLAVVLVVGCDRTASHPAPPPRANPAATTQALAPAPDLRQRLTTGRWVRDLSGPMNGDRFIYTFAADGTYANHYTSDFDYTMTGRWELRRDDAGADHLLLHGHDPAKDYYWLGADSIVRLDEATGNLSVSGPRYVGQVPLLHER